METSSLLFLGGAVVGALAAHCASVLAAGVEGGEGQGGGEGDETLVVAVGFFDGDGGEEAAAGADGGLGGDAVAEGPAGRLLGLLRRLLPVTRRQVVLVHDDMSFRLATGRPPVLREEQRAGRVLAALPGAEVRILPAGGFGVREQLIEEVSRAAAGRVLLVVPAVGPCACCCHRSGGQAEPKAEAQPEPEPKAAAVSASEQE